MSLRVLNLLVSFLKKQVSTYLRKEIKLRTKSNGCGLHYLLESAELQFVIILHQTYKEKAEKKTLRELMFNIFLVRLRNLFVH